MARILVRAVRRGFYGKGSDAELKYPASEKNRGERAGATFLVEENEFSPVRVVPGTQREIGWMERVQDEEGNGDSKDIATKRIFTQEEADASPIPLPHVRRNTAPDYMEKIQNPPRRRGRPTLLESLKRAEEDKEMAFETALANKRRIEDERENANVKKIAEEKRPKI